MSFRANSLFNRLLLVLKRKKKNERISNFNCLSVLFKGWTKSRPIQQTIYLVLIDFIRFIVICLLDITVHRLNNVN